MQTHTPKCKLYLIVSEVYIIINGQHSLCLNIGEWKEPVVQTVALGSNNLVTTRKIERKESHVGEVYMHTCCVDWPTQATNTTVTFHFTFNLSLLTI